MSVRFLREDHDSARNHKLDPDFKVVLVDRGSGVLADSAGQYETHAGDVVVFEPGAQFRYTPISPTRLSVATIDGSLMLDMAAWMHARTSIHGRARVRSFLQSLQYPVLVFHPDRKEFRRLQRLVRSAIAHQLDHGDAAPPVTDGMLSTVVGCWICCTRW